MRPPTPHFPVVRWFRTLQVLVSVSDNCDGGADLRSILPKAGPLLGPVFLASIPDNLYYWIQSSSAPLSMRLTYM